MAPSGANVNVLIAGFTTTGAMVAAGSTVQISRSSANDFTNPVLYVVTASSGIPATRTVTVSLTPSAGKAFYLHRETGTLSAAARQDNVFHAWPVRGG